MRVLLIEDDRMIGKAVRQALRDASWAVDWVEDGDVGATALERRVFELVLLDLGLPSRDGLTILRDLRASGNDVPVIIITARDGFDQRVAALDLGADDYLIKPFNVDEMLARMRAVCRRRIGMASSVVAGGVVTLDLVTKRATVGDESWALSRREFALLRELMVRPGAILSRQDLEERIYGSGEAVESNAIDFIIHGLRKKLGPGSIRNVRGLGWTVEKP